MLLGVEEWFPMIIVIVVILGVLVLLVAAQREFQRLDGRGLKRFPLTGHAGPRGTTIARMRRGAGPQST